MDNKLDVEFLSGLFEMSNITDGSSLKKVNEIGGESGLLKAFQSNSSVWVYLY